MFYANVLMKWIHLSSAATVVGGLIYLRFVLIPSLEGLPDGRENPLWQSAYRKSFRILMWAIALLLLTGLDNIFKVRKTLNNLSPELVAQYWTVFWIKMGLFLLAFFFVHALFVRAPMFRKIRENPKSGVTMFLVVALAILFCSGYLTLTRLSVLTSGIDASAPIVR